MAQSQPKSPSSVWGWAFMGLAVALLAGGALFLSRWTSSSDMIEIALPTPTVTPRVLVVHVTGAVARPGVYNMLPGQRVQDALIAAGGPVEQANPQALNLASALRDGQKVYVPFLEAATPQPGGAEGRKVPVEPDGTDERKVPINSATARELESLPLIGEKKAQDIVSYRDAHGQFQRLGDLLLVPGIGPITLEQLRDRITLD